MLIILFRCYIYDRLRTFLCWEFELTIQNSHVFMIIELNLCIKNSVLWFMTLDSSIIVNICLFSIRLFPLFIVQNLNNVESSHFLTRDCAYLPLTAPLNAVRSNLRFDVNCHALKQYGLNPSTNFRFKYYIPQLGVCLLNHRTENW